MTYDLAIIGAGWAGFNAALKAKQAGLKVALIENGQIGGTCLNRGCIPTKTLIQSAKVYSLCKKAKNFGIEIADSKINFTEVHARKDRVTQQLRQGMEFLLKDIELLRGNARITSEHSIKVNDNELAANTILIATGSVPAQLKDIKFDGKKIISSDEMLGLKEIPGSILIIGGGVIGCEFASLFNTLGTRISIIEKMPNLLPGVDKDIAKKLELVFKKKGIKVGTNTDAQNADFNSYDLVLLSVGRIPKIENLGLEELGVIIEKGKIKTDEYLRTNIPNIYAAGDCTGQVCLAHFAAYQGAVAAQNIAYPDKLKKADNRVVPNCIFTEPQAAAVGYSQEEAEKNGFKIKINRFDFLSSGMARILDDTDGFIKIISDETSDKILGASIIGPLSTELIAVVALAISQNLQISQLRDTIFAHPTLSECIHEALK